MKHILTVIIFIFVFTVSAKTQVIDTSLFAECRALYGKEQLKEARDCYLAIDNNIYAVYGAALISQQLNDSKQFEQLSKKLISEEYSSVTGYKLCAGLYSVDSKKYNQIVQKGLKLFKNDTILLTLQANYYLTIKDYVNSIKTVDLIILLKHSSDKNLFFIKGNAYQSLNDDMNALMNFNKAIQLDSNYFDAYFNIATIFYNKAVGFYTLAQNEKNSTEKLSLTSKAETELAKAIPYLKKAGEIQPDNLTVLDALKTIYQALKNSDELQKIKARIEEIQKG